MRISTRLIKVGILSGFFLIFSSFIWVSRARADAYAVARTSAREGQVSIQVAQGSEYVDMTVNMPVEPGDRVWAGDDGMAEFEMSDGSIVRISFGTKADFLSVPQFNSDSPAAPVVRLLSGEAYFETREGQTGGTPMTVETPSGSVRLTDPGVYRVDLDKDGNAQISVFNGAADAESPSGSTTVGDGQRTYLFNGRGPDQPIAFDTTEEDAFARWNTQMDSRYASAGGTVEQPSNIPSDVEPYYPELSQYGSWVYDDDYNTDVWRPAVSADWQPYRDGYWDQEPWGPCWVSYEPWGWAPYHFGRWSFSASLGWCWIPGSVWAPAWVDWWVGPGYLGWCPLDYYGYPVSTFGFALGSGGERFFDRDHEHRFGRDGTFVGSRGWTVVGEHDIFSRHVRDHALPARVVSSLDPGVLQTRAPRLNPRDPAGSLREAYGAGLEGNGVLVGTEHRPAPESGMRAALQPVASLAQERQQLGGSREVLASRGRVGPTGGAGVVGPSGLNARNRVPMPDNGFRPNTNTLGSERVFSSSNNSFRSVQRQMPENIPPSRSIERTVRPTFHAPSTPYSGGFAARQPSYYASPRMAYPAAPHDSAPQYSAPRYSAPQYSAPRYSSPGGGYRSMPSGGFRGGSGGGGRGRR